MQATFFDAVAETVWAEYTVRTLAGDMLGPVLTKTYWLDNFGSMAAVRRDFKAQLLDYEGDRYFAFAHALDTLPSAVSQEQFEKARVELEQQNAFRAVQDLCRYGRLWNVLE